MMMSMIVLLSCVCVCVCVIVSVCVFMRWCVSTAFQICNIKLKQQFEQQQFEQHQFEPFSLSIHVYIFVNVCVYVHTGNSTFSEFQTCANPIQYVCSKVCVEMQQKERGQGKNHVRARKESCEDDCY